MEGAVVDANLPNLTSYHHLVDDKHILNIGLQHFNISHIFCSCKAVLACGVRHDDVTPTKLARRESVKVHRHAAHTVMNDRVRLRDASRPAGQPPSLLLHLIFVQYLYL